MLSLLMSLESSSLNGQLDTPNVSRRMARNTMEEGEQVVTVAGVRGAEAEDEALHHLYYRKSMKGPNKMELQSFPVDRKSVV